MKKTIVLIIVLLSLCGCSETENLEAKKVSCDQKNEILTQGKNTMLIDVRTEEEYNAGHLKGAINMPYEKIIDILSTYGTIDFNVPIIVYCKSGGRSAMASDSLLNAGYKNVYDLGAMSNCQ